MKKEKQEEVKQFAMKALAAFLALMLLLTGVSRTANAMTVSKAEVGRPKAGRIDQKIEATGRLRPKDEESMEVGKGLLVKNIFVEEGDRVQAGEELIELDTKELTERLEDIKTELKKLQLRLQEMGLNEDFSQALTPTEKAKEKIARLEEDKVVLQQKEALKVARQEEKIKVAEAALLEAQQVLEDFKGANLEEQIKKAEEAVKEAQKHLEEQQYESDKAIARAEKALKDAKEQLWMTGGGDATMALQNYERAKMEYDFTKSDWDRKVKDAKESLAKAKEKLKNLQNGEVDEDALKQEEEKVKAKEQSVADEKRVLEDVILAKEEAMNDMERQLLDAQNALVLAEKEEASMSLEDEQDAQKQALQVQLMQLDIETKKREISRMNEVIAQGGKLVAPTNGIVQGIKVEKGGTTSGGELLTFVGDDSTYIFEAELSEEQSKYLKIGDSVQIFLESNQMPVGDTVVENIVYVADSTSNKKKVRVMVPEGTPGMQATMKVTRESEKYNMIIPIEALRQENGNKYILVARKKTTTLGEEWIAERVEVMEKDKNTSSVAVEAPLMAEDQIIIKANKPIQAGDRVRLVEP
ncbi:MAG: efflux RND transporter periplasmic adaptor subunit [Cellulosilyticaceae bacterium]